MADNGQLFQVAGKKLGENKGAPRFFTLQVLARLNNAPSFLPNDVFCNQDTGMQRLIFASEVRAGGEYEKHQRLAWQVRVDTNGVHSGLLEYPPVVYSLWPFETFGLQNPDCTANSIRACLPAAYSDQTGSGIFSVGPFFEVTEINGNLYGVMRFQTAPSASGRISFQVTLHDDGRLTSDSPDLRNPKLSEVRRQLDVEYGTDDILDQEGRAVKFEAFLAAKAALEADDNSISLAQKFMLTVRKVNQAPFISFPDKGINLVAERSSVVVAPKPIPVFLPKWANVSAGSRSEDTEQKVSFSLAGVKAINSRWPGEGLVSNLNILNDGTLKFILAPARTGVFVMNVMAVDDGGTAYGGLDWSIISIPLKIVEQKDASGIVADSVPTLQGPRQLTVPEAKDNFRQVFPNYLEDIGVGDLTEEDRSKAFVFQYENSNAFLFLQGPSISYPNGTITFTLRPFANGVAHLSVYLVAAGANSTRRKPNISETFPFDITVLPVNDPPSFQLLPSVGAVQDSEPFFLPGFVHDIVAGPPDESWQMIYYNTTFVTQAPNLFASPPEIDMFGSLRFICAPGQHGSGLIRVVATDDAGTDFDGQATSNLLETPFKIYPLPLVLDVVPAVLPSTGGVEITLVGLYFGSSYSRGYDEPEGGYGLLDVMVGGRHCTDVSVASDVMVRCVVPPMVGAQIVEVVIREPGFERSARYRDTIRFNTVYFGGLYRKLSSRGVFGAGPFSNLTVPFVELSREGRVPKPPTEWKGVPVSVDDMVVDNAVLSMTCHGSSVLMGGNFKHAAGVKVNHIMEWKGGIVRSLGKGVDGSVHSLIIYQDLLVVGGAFTKAYQSNGGALRTGGLAGWRLDGIHMEAGKWELVGAPLQGAVTTSAVNGSRLFVGGRFNQFCSQRFNGVAMYDGRSWMPLGHGVAGGAVMSMAVLGDLLYIGGDFSSAGGKQLSKVAAWNVETSTWNYVGGVDGDVLALIQWDAHILAGGTFSTAGGKLAFGVARYTPANETRDNAVDDGWNFEGAPLRIGKWNAVGRGIEGRVHSLAAAGGCLYAAGALTNVSDHLGSRPAIANLARYCPRGEDADERDLSAVWEPAIIANAAEQQDLSPLYALSSAIPPGIAYWDPLPRDFFWRCTRAIKQTNGNATVIKNVSIELPISEAVNAEDGMCVRLKRPLPQRDFY
jgi:hypothetical protein